MLLELATHIFSLDAGWLIAFVMDNLAWVFLMGCLGTFVFRKNPISGGIFVAIYLYATFDFAGILGWVFQKGIFWVPIMGFVTLVMYDALLARIAFFSKNRALFASLIFYFNLFAVNVLL